MKHVPSLSIYMAAIVKIGKAMQQTGHVITGKTAMQYLVGWQDCALSATHVAL